MKYFLIALMIICFVMALKNSLPDKEEGQKTAPQNSPQSPPPAVEKLLTIPLRVEGHPLSYSYTFQFVPADGIDVAAQVWQNAEKYINVSSSGDMIELRHDGILFGTIADAHKAKMLSDWVRRGFPYLAVLKDPGDQINLRFYKDKRVDLGHRESEVFALISYKSRDKQDILWISAPGDELEIREVYDDASDSEKLFVLQDNDVIGRLPKRIEQKVIDESYHSIFIEQVEREEADDLEPIYKPFVRIYW